MLIPSTYGKLRHSDLPGACVCVTGRRGLDLPNQSSSRCGHLLSPPPPLEASWGWSLTTPQIKQTQAHRLGLDLNSPCPVPLADRTSK